MANEYNELIKHVDEYNYLGVKIINNGEKRFRTYIIKKGNLETPHFNGILKNKRTTTV